MQIFLNVFYRPERSFRVLADPLFSHRRFFFFYGLPLMLVGSLGRVLAAMNRFENADHISLVVSAIPLTVMLFIVNFVSYVVTFLLGAQLLSRLSPRFGATASFGTMLTMIVYSYTPFLVVQLFAFPLTIGRFISLLGLIYTVWLYVKGSVVMAYIPAKKIAGFTMVSFLLLLGVFYIIGLFSSGMFIFGV